MQHLRDNLKLWTFNMQRKLKKNLRPTSNNFPFFLTIDLWVVTVLEEMIIFRDDFRICLVQLLLLLRNQ
uniref:Uncharacterized protein n=1 Tax=Helianthus annuus TaxID=4232 RepID=A0A251VGQ5_HELAN